MCASEEGVKGLRALGVRVPDPGRALAQDGHTDGRKDKQTDGRADGRTDGRMDGRTDGWINGRLDGRTTRGMEILPYVLQDRPLWGRPPKGKVERTGEYKLGDRPTEGLSVTRRRVQ